MRLRRRRRLRLMLHDVHLRGEGNQISRSNKCCYDRRRLRDRGGIGTMDDDASRTGRRREAGVDGTCCCCGGGSGSKRRTLRDEIRGERGEVVSRGIAGASDANWIVVRTAWRWELRRAGRRERAGVDDATVGIDEARERTRTHDERALLSRALRRRYDGTRPRGLVCVGIDRLLYTSVTNTPDFAFAT